MIDPRLLQALMDAAAEPEAHSARVYDLPWPPSINHYKQPAMRKGGGQRLRLSNDALAYRWEAVAAIRFQHGRQACMYDELACVFQMQPPRRGVDIDNYHKGVLDALEAASVFRNDNQIRLMATLMGEPVRPGRVVVTLVPMPPTH